MKSLKLLKTTGSVTNLTGVVLSVSEIKRGKERYSATFRIKVGHYKFNTICHDTVLHYPPSVNDIWRVEGEHKNDVKCGPQFVVASGKRLIISNNTDQSIICDYIIQNKSFVGISNSWVKKLNNAFPKKLKQTLDSVEASVLVAHPKLKMPELLAESLLQSWLQCTFERKLLTFLINKNISINLLPQLINLYGLQAIENINSDPYRLLSFMPPQNALSHWRTLDSTAFKYFAINKKDPRRVISAIEAILYQAYDTNGHMALPIDIVQDTLINEGIEHDIGNILHHSEQNLLVHHQTGFIQSLGCWSLETIVARRLNALNGDKNSTNVDLQNSVLNDFERDQSLDNSTNEFKLNSIQLKAIELALKSNLSIINGGPNTGKTMVMLAIIRQYENQNKRIFVLSATESSVKRLAIEYGKKSENVSTFIGHIKESIKNSDLSQALIIIDMASMIDTATAYVLLKAIPNDCRLCLIGDDKLLPPIGAGILFHQLTAIPHLSITLNIPYNLGSEADLNQFKHAIYIRDIKTVKNIISPYQINPEANVTWHIPQIVARQSLCKAALNIWYDKKKMDKPLQIFSSSNRICQDINQEIQLIRNYKKSYDSKEVNDQKFIKGDPVIYENNNKELGISTGSIGKISEIFTPRKTVNFRECIIQVDFEEGSKYLTEEDCLSLKLSYCINVIKAQGCTFDDIIVIVDTNYPIDHSWLYTAVSFTKKSIVLISNAEFIEKSILSEQSNFSRHIGSKIKIKKGL
ncbi:AAA family ATPase [Colwellia demingiae]|uniref:AAA family ATPase n=1 Tax=Colwellia demingiae TaxID=89401 RepID=A0A5C6QHV9_9GAMM|nr:ATP-dependent RecD-like DNA helicase [Colwellia demingiae]TWX68479.1 AAA family ATPase [Colwellia demingiae]